MLFVEDKVFIINPVATTGQYTLVGYHRKRLVKIFVSPTTASTQYDINVVDKNNLTVYSNSSIVGVFIDSTINENVYGNFTLQIANATVDEPFNVLLVFIEEVP